jgi:hypothetical protein
MSKILSALIAAGFGLGLNASMAQNVNSDKDKTQGQDKVMQDKEQPAKQGPSTSQQGQPGTDRQKIKADSAQSGNAQSAKTPQDCSNLSGKEKDKCKQATPAGAVDMRTGEESQAKSEEAKDRDREKAENQTDTNAPAQSNSAVGHPEERATTGEGQTGADAKKDTSSGQNQSGKSESGKSIPGQSKGTVGHPEERTTTGEGQSGQEPGAKTSKDSNQKSDKESAQSQDRSNASATGSSGAQTDKLPK